MLAHPRRTKRFLRYPKSQVFSPWMEQPADLVRRCNPSVWHNSIQGDWASPPSTPALFVFILRPTTNGPAQRHVCQQESTDLCDSTGHDIDAHGLGLENEQPPHAVRLILHPLWLIACVSNDQLTRKAPHPHLNANVDGTIAVDLV
jgi:hypothetical protein